MDYQMTEQERVSFLKFAADFPEDVRKGLAVFCDYVVGRAVIPYKIKNREFVVRVADTAAFSITLTFHEVLIEDGRHPREILMTQVRGQKTAHGARIYFKNALAPEGLVKESSFYFESVTAKIELWNYNLSTVPIDLKADKVPWRLVAERINAFMDKWHILGDGFFNTYEKNSALFFNFLYLYLGWYLHEDTVIGYGRTNVRYDKTLQEICYLEPQVRKAARDVFVQCQWDDMLLLLDNYETDAYAFFEAWVYKITYKDGRGLFDFVCDLLDKCCRNYSRMGSVLSIYAGSHSMMKSMLDNLFKNRGWFGHYPSYSYIERPKFIETNTVYERKYTYINEKKKTVFLRFLESVHDGGIQIAAVEGSILSREHSEKTMPGDALYAYFSDGGRRAAHMIEEVFITENMAKEELSRQVTLFFKKCMDHREV